MPPTARALADSAQMDFLWMLFRPLLKVDEARFLLADCSPQTIVRRLEDGSLRGVDISAEGEESGRRELRIYRYTVAHLIRMAPGKPAAHPVETIFPHRRDCLRRDEVAQLLNCEPRHVGNLPLVGPRLAASSSQASVDRTPRVTRASLIEFLDQREVRA